MNIIIREATKADAQAVREIIDACSEQLHERGYDHWRYYYEPSTPDSRLAKPKNAVAFFEGKVIACITYEEVLENNYFYEDYNLSEQAKAKVNGKSLLYITTLAVHPTLQGKGTGDKMMDFVENIAKQNNQLPILTMRTELANLVEFYANRKYVEIGRMHKRNDEHYSLLIK